MVFLALLVTGSATFALAVIIKRAVVNAPIGLLCDRFVVGDSDHGPRSRPSACLALVTVVALLAGMALTAPAAKSGTTGSEKIVSGADQPITSRVVPGEQTSGASQSAPRSDAVAKPKPPQRPKATPKPSLPPEAKADALFAEAGALWGKGDLEGSLAKAQEALAVYQSIPGANHPKIGQVKKAIEMAKAAMARGGAQSSSGSVGQSAAQPAQPLLQTEEPFDAVKLLAQADAMVAESGTLWQAGNHEQSLDRALEAALLYLVLCGPDHPKVAVVSQAVVKAASADPKLMAHLAEVNSPERTQVRAQALLAEAGVLWKAGRREWSYIKAKTALVICQAAFGDEHPEVVKIRGMVDNAGAALGLAPGAPLVPPPTSKESSESPNPE